MKHLPVADKEYSARTACRLDTVRYHKDGLSLPVDLWCVRTGAAERPKTAGYFKDVFAAGGDMAQVPVP